MAASLQELRWRRLFAEMAASIAKEPNEEERHNRMLAAVAHFSWNDDFDVVTFVRQCELGTDRAVL